jgi:hypothetical protein
VTNSLTPKIDKVAKQVRNGAIGHEEAWQGADVVICLKAPPPSRSFYPNPRYVETGFVGELSWLFVKLRNIFSNEDGYGAWKEEFFGRLGNVAIKYQAVTTGLTCGNLLLAVIHEAYAMAEEIADTGEIATMMLTSNNRIFDDFTGISDLSAYLTTEETTEFLRGLGLA